MANLLRNLLFFSVFIPYVIVFSFVCVLIFPFLRTRRRLAIGSFFNKVIVRWFAFALDVTYEIEGLENIPKDQPFILLSNHQSQWETFYLQTVYQPICTVLKRELLRIPLFGWALGMSGAIAIDRASKMQAIKQIVKKALPRLQSGYSILLFPEGTRRPPGRSKKFSATGAFLAIETGFPILPVAHNAGEVWPAKGWRKRSGGVIKVKFGELIISKGKTRDELYDASSEWIRNECDGMTAASKN